jgi:hypothetical protein
MQLTENQTKVLAKLYLDFNSGAKSTVFTINNDIEKDRGLYEAIEQLVPMGCVNVMGDRRKVGIVKLGLSITDKGIIEITNQSKIQ